MPQINFTEKELEDYLCSSKNLEKHLGLRLLARQYRTPAGVIDIVAYNKRTKRFVIIELKKDALNASAYFQIERYRNYFSRVSDGMWDVKNERQAIAQFHDPQIIFKKPCNRREFDCLLVGVSLSPELDYVAERWDNDSDMQDCFRVWYTCFGYDFNKGIDFSYYSISQDKTDEVFTETAESAVYGS